MLIMTEASLGSGVAGPTPVAAAAAPAQLLAGSRKGLFVWEHGPAGWRLAGHHLAGEPVTQVLVDARDGSWIVALRMGHFGVKLRKSVDRGQQWIDIAAPTFPAKPDSGPWADDPTPWTVDMVWSLAAGGPDEPGVLWAGCMPAGLFRSADGGQSWQLCEALWLEPRRRAWFGGGNDQAGIHSVLVDPRDTRHLTLGISCGGVWQSHNAGASWTLTAEGMRASYMPPDAASDPNTQDPHALAQCAGQPGHVWAQHHCGIYRSTDGARTWQSVPVPQGPSDFGFAVACDPANPLRAWFVPAAADTHRYAVDGRLAVLRTDDGGASFVALREGLPQAHAYHLVYRHALQVAADGRHLAMGSTTGGLWLSANAGEQWMCLSRDLPPLAVLHWVD
jgi:hypothetical protein